MPWTWHSHLLVSAYLRGGGGGGGGGGYCYTYAT